MSFSHYTTGRNTTTGPSPRTHTELHACSVAAPGRLTHNSPLIHPTKVKLGSFREAELMWTTVHYCESLRGADCQRRVRTNAKYHTIIGHHCLSSSNRSLSLFFFFLPCNKYNVCSEIDTTHNNYSSAVKCLNWPKFHWAHLWARQLINGEEKEEKTEDGISYWLGT